MAEIKVPKLNANDISYTIVEWCYDDGAEVPAGAPVVVLETSKATAELTSGCAGYLRRLRPEQAECRAGDVIGQVAGSRPEWAAAAPAPPEPEPPADSGHRNGRAAPVITNGARRRMSELGITAGQVQSLQRKVVRTADIDAMIAGDSPAGAAEAAGGAPVTGAPGSLVLPRHQQAVAAVVAASHATIPAAFLAARVILDGALAAAATLTGQTGVMVGISELAVRAVAQARAELPVFFAAPVAGPDGGEGEQPAAAPPLALAAGAHVGITMDTGRGLSVPVIRDADTRPFAEIARQLFQFRMRSVRGTFRAADLEGANILLSLNSDAPVEFAVPIILPGTVCAVSLGAARPEVSASPEGELRTHQAVLLGIAYDHRIINGRDAAGFLRLVKSTLESPGWLADP
jgi:2-oxoglutarate dehydrogenase E2 component (dihydrolipoamide succinyltransferase)